MRGAVPIALLAALVLNAGCTRTPASDERAKEPEPQAEKTPEPQAAPDRTPPPDAEKSASGLFSKVLKAGAGDARPEPHDKVVVHFTGWNEKGKLVDSSAKRGGPVTFDVTGVIAGWTEALQQMRVGEQRRIWVPDELGYPGRPGFPRGMAVFDIELVEIIDGKPPLPAPEDVAAAPADATETRSGLAYKLLAQGDSGEKPNAWDRVTLHYTGWTRDGVMFESTRNREQAAIVDIATAMPGWREALPLLSVGDRARLWIPEALAYQGRAGRPAGTVVFDVELLAVERRPEPPRAPADVRRPRGATKTRSGLAYRWLSRGPGEAKPTKHDRVEVHYSAWTTDGELFDSSVVRGRPAVVPVDRLIPGWAEGLQLMAEGDKALFWIPEKLAYAGRPGSPAGMLVYEVELLRIVK